MEAKSKEYQRLVASGEWEENEEKEADADSDDLSNGSLYEGNGDAEEEPNSGDIYGLADRDRDPDAWKKRTKGRRIKAVAEEQSVNSVAEMPSGETGNTELLLAPPPTFDGGLNMKNYFGSKARSGFFSLYQKYDRSRFTTPIYFLISRILSYCIELRDSIKWISSWKLAMKRMMVSINFCVIYIPMSYFSMYLQTARGVMLRSNGRCPQDTSFYLCWSPKESTHRFLSLFGILREKTS